MVVADEAGWLCQIGTERERHTQRKSWRGVEKKKE